MQPARASAFAQAAKAYIAANKSGWLNAKHVAQWESTIVAYATQTLRRLDCTAITTADVLRLLQPIWAPNPEPATAQLAVECAALERLPLVLDDGCADHILPAVERVGGWHVGGREDRFRWWRYRMQASTQVMADGGMAVSQQTSQGPAAPGGAA